MREWTATDGTVSYKVPFRHGGKQSSRTFGTAEAAENFIDAIRVLGVKRALAELEGAPARGVTLDALAAAFFEWKRKRVRSERTVDDYERDYRNWIKGRLGWRAAADIDETDVQDWVDSMIGHLSAKTIAGHHAMLHSIFKFGSAPRRALIPVGHNPTVGTELPVKVKKPPKGFKLAEWQAFHTALTQINADAADLAEFLLASGWRFSEATALSTYEFEDDGRYVHVTMSQVARRQSNGAVRIVQDAKSKAGLRRLRLDLAASAMVRRRIANLEPGQLVFTTTQGSMWNASHFRNRFWNKALKAAGLDRKPPNRPTPHWLRHTNVALLNAAGASIAEMQRRIGHESIKTTIDVYGGMIDDISDETLDRLAMIRADRVGELAEVGFERAEIERLAEIEIDVES